MHSSGKTPLIRLAKRDGMAGAGQWGIRIAAILLALVVGGHTVNWTIFALLALPLILCRTHSGLRIPKWFFYAFYPAHLAVIALVGGCMGV